MRRQIKMVKRGGAVKKIAVFCSGGGTNFQSIIDAVESEVIKNAEIAALIADNENIGAVIRAQKHNIPYFIFDKTAFPSLERMYGEITALLKSLCVDLIVFAGYLTVAPPGFIKAFPEKIINIHPSLIPKYCGKGFYGLRVHRAVLEAGEKVSGCTVHFVDEGTDTGKVIAQRSVPVLPGDTAEILQNRVLAEEHKLLVETVRRLTGENGGKNPDKRGRRQ